MRPSRYTAKKLGFIPDCCVSPPYSRFGWFGPVKGLTSTPTMDNLAPAMGTAVSTILATCVRIPDQAEDPTSCLSYMAF
ncbi:unnamed protein product [Echinostoma caproni]|uniref:Uncharacterized protein n=1 Tax=Echinostoma caproni TaxID=27848 RepID=A0A183AYY0_9TREM|nr:unnamed protein product [Echinostoma caproni]